MRRTPTYGLPRSAPSASQRKELFVVGHYSASNDSPHASTASFTSIRRWTWAFQGTPSTGWYVRMSGGVSSQRCSPLTLTTNGWRQGVLAACLWAGTGAAASHVSAAAVWELDGIAPRATEILVAARKRSPPQGIVVHEASAPFAIQRRAAIPVTSATKTLIDLASVLPVERLEIALEDALRRRLTSVVGMQRAIGRGQGLRGIIGLRRLVDARSSDGTPMDSALEVAVLQILRAAKLPAPVPQYVVRNPGGQTVRLDFAYPDALVGIEVDGYRWHSGRAAWSRDRVRLNWLCQTGWRILHVTNDEVRVGAPDLVAALRTFLGQQRL